MSEGIKFFGFLGASLAVHVSLFIVMPYHTITQAIRPLKPIEVSYEIRKPAIFNKAPASKRMPEVAVKGSGKTPWSENKVLPEFLKNEIYKPLNKEGIASIKKNVSLPSIPGETFKTPEYKSYYQLIREKIRRFAYYNYKKLQEGEVFLTFSLTPQGELADVAINEQKSSNDEYLRDIALNSIKDAAPFPDFPEKLKNNQKLAFNVIISFEVK